MKRLRIGYVPLSDAAVLIAAATRGFAEAERLSIELVREVSWANIRDKLILGHFDAAHMLAPFAIATTLGLGHLKVPLIAPFALNLNGNAITISSLVHAQMTGEIGRAPESAAESAEALAAVIRRRKSDKQEPLAFGIVFPFSTHAYLLRHWLRSGGIDPERDVNLVVVPPPYMAESLRTGLLDGFCVGSPWNSLAVDAHVGCIAALGVDIAKHAPEKILAVPKAFAEENPEIMGRLIRSARAAARWCADEQNRADLAGLLASRDHLGLPEHIIRDTLDGNLAVGAGGRRRAHADFLVLGRETTNRPDPRHAKWLYTEMVRARQAAFNEDAFDEAASVYRPDLYDEATGETDIADGDDPVRLTQGPAFSENDPRAYLAALG